MREILADLVAEQQALDQMLQRSPDRDWKRRTRSKGWTVHDTISHLAWSEDYAMHALQGDRKRLREAAESGGVDGFNEMGIKAGRGKRPQEVIEWWRFSRAAVVDSLSRRKPEERIPWYVGDMSARTLPGLTAWTSKRHSTARTRTPPGSATSPGSRGPRSPMPSKRPARSTQSRSGWS
jgi:uncharacterized protein (TIGR03084 family)